MGRAPMSDTDRIRLRGTPPGLRARATRQTRRRTRRTGQSLVEFALLLPVVLLVVLIGLDFGRVFLGWIELHSMARVAANLAAEYPEAWSTYGGDAAAQAEYTREMQAQAAGINCTLPSPLPLPSFPNGLNSENFIGTPVSVTVTCSFGLITPVIGAILPNPLPVTASAAFPIRNGTIFGMPTFQPTQRPEATATPSPSPTPSPTPEPTAANPSASPTVTPVPTPTPSPTPPMCTVPNLIGVDIKLAAYHWGPDKLRGNSGEVLIDGAGFATTLVFSPLVGNGDKGQISSQSIIAGSSRPCSSTAMTVTWSPR